MRMMAIVSTSYQAAMKRTRLTLLALASLLALGAAAPSAFADPRDHHHDRGHYDRGHDRGWHGGPPPHAHVWARGQRYKDYYRGPVYVVNDYPRYHVRQPPRGYRWVRDDRGNLLMVAIATGIIADLVLHH